MGSSVQRPCRSVKKSKSLSLKQLLSLPPPRQSLCALSREKTALRHPRQRPLSKIPHQMQLPRPISPRLSHRSHLNKKNQRLLRLPKTLPPHPIPQALRLPQQSPPKTKQPTHQIKKNLIHPPPLHQIQLALAHRNLPPTTSCVRVTISGVSPVITTCARKI